MAVRDLFMAVERDWTSRDVYQGDNTSSSRPVLKPS
jgi:hypothetical protein